MSDEIRYESVFDALRVGLIAVDEKGRVELQNPEASRILGVSAVSTAGRTLAAVLGQQHPAAALVTRVLATGRDLSENASDVPCRTGEPLTVDLSARPLSADRSGAVLTLYDRTIGQRLEALVDQRARDELYAQLAAGLAHEVRNPLGGIRGTAELLETRLEDPSLAKYPRLIRDETDRIRRLLDEFSELTRGGELQLVRINLHEVLDKLLALQQRSAAWSGIEVRREYDPSIPELALDPDRITQVFLNLCRNAVQAMDGRGRLTLRTRVDTIYQLRSSEERGPAHMVRVELLDTGPGIPEEHLAHVFTPFFTRREQGTGLGLPIAQHWVLRHGGQIEIAAGHAGGTQVRVLLPIGSP